MVLRDPTAEDSFADILAAIRFGMAIAATTRMIATTIRSSINEKPFWFLRIFAFAPSALESPVFPGTVPQCITSVPLSRRKRDGATVSIWGTPLCYPGRSSRTRPRNLFRRALSHSCTSMRASVPTRTKRETACAGAIASFFAGGYARDVSNPTVCVRFRAATRSYKAGLVQIS